MPTNDPRERCMFHFAIRDVLWLTVVVAMGVGWLVDHSVVAQRRNMAIQQRDAAIADAQKLANYWDYFLPLCREVNLAPFFNQDVTRYVHWRQFQRVRERYETEQRPLLDND